VIKRLTIWRPREGVSREAALVQWRGSHVGLVERVPGVRRYVQDECLVGPDGSEPPAAGVGELWFDSAEAAKAALATPEWQAVIADASAFMDLENVSALWVEEHEVF
jgi:uncharacterized protein (TIGR02118 family)